MKKVTSIMLSITILLGIFIPSKSLANHNQNLEKIIEKSKQILEIGEEYSQFDYSISKTEEGTIYNLSWRNDEDTEFISVGIDSKGFIMNYDKYSNQDDYSNKLPNITEEEGKKISEEFLKKINPEIQDNLKYKGNELSREILVNHYYFDFVRIENGIPYTNNSANITVDKMTGEVRNYYVSWDDDMNFPNDKDVISKEQANKVYKEKIRFELMYKRNFTEKNPKPQLVYSVVDKNKSIDAETGNLIDHPNDYFYGGRMIKEELGRREDSNLTKEELDAIKNAKDMINEKQAEDIARDVAQIDKEYKLSHLTMFKEQGSHMWYLDFTKQDENNFYNALVSVDAKTKEVVYFNKYRGNESKGKQKYSKDEAFKIAEEYLNKIQSDKSNQVEYIEMNYPESRIYRGESRTIYSFKFMRKSNDILFAEDGFDITVDSSNGEILSYNSSWYKGELPSPTGVISKEEAYKIFSNKANLELQYINLVDNNEKENKDTVLAYVLSNRDNLDVDAKTGEFVNLYNYPGNINKDKPEYTDIENSIAENQIKTLKELGIYLPGEQFKPKEQITQKDFLYLLSKSNEGYIKYEDLEELYRILISQKTIKKEEKSPEASVNREEAVKYIVRSLNYAKVADIKDIYVLEFKDKENISQELKGYVAIAKGLGIVNGTSTGEFKPKDKLTREQAILIIYNMLNTEK